MGISLPMTVKVIYLELSHEFSKCEGMEKRMIHYDLVMDMGVFDARDNLFNLFIGWDILVIEESNACILELPHDFR